MAAIRRKLTLISQLRLISEATADNASPTTGSHFNDICRITFQSVQMCSELQCELVNRLNKKSVFTKAKVLKVLKYLVEHGHESFQQDLQRRTEEIRKCINFKGPMDVLHGDTYNALVRDSAEELMDSLYDTHTAPRVAPGQHGNNMPSSSTNSVSGMGSGSVAQNADYSGSYSPNSARKAMVGFGNQQAPVEPTTRGDKLKAKIKASVANAKTAAVASMHRMSEKLPEKYKDRVQDKLPENKGQTKHMDPRLQATGLGGYGGSGGYGGGSNDGGRHETYQAPTAGVWSPPEATASSNSGTHEVVHTDDAYESRLIDDITAPVGVGSAPNKKVLREFITKCSSLDCHKISILLEPKLDASSHKTCVRALHVVRALADCSIPGIKPCLASLEPSLQELTQAANTGIREGAGIALRKLAEGAETPGPAAQVDSTTSKIKEVSILDLGLDMGGPSVSTGTTAKAGGMSLFDGFTMGSSTAGGSSGGLLDETVPTTNSSAGPAQVPTPDLLGLLGDGGGAPRASTPSSMFADMEMRSENTASPAPATTQTHGNLMSLDSLMLAPSASTAPAPASAPKPSAFGFIGATPTSASATPRPAAAPTSSFSFIDNGGSAAPSPSLLTYQDSLGPARTDGQGGLAPGYPQQPSATAPLSAFGFMGPGPAQRPASSLPSMAIHCQTSGGLLMPGQTTLHSSPPKKSTDDPFGFISAEVAANKK